MNDSSRTMTNSTTANATTSITIDKRRLQRVGEILGRLSVGDAEVVNDKIAVTVPDDFGAFEEMLNIFIDEYVAALRDNEQLERQRLETIDRQQAAIADLSVPVIDVWDDIVMLPIVGVVDTKRSVEMTQRLLQRVAAGNGRCVIIDLTGIDVVDTSAADHLIRMMRSVQLLGSSCVISGISPNIAQTLVQLDVDIGDTIIVRNLQEALTVCFGLLDNADGAAAPGGRRRG